MTTPSQPSAPAAQRTERLVLRPLTEEDLPELFALHSDPRTFVHDTTTPLDTLEEMRSVLATWCEQAAAQGFGYMGVRTASGDGRLLGVAGLTRLEPAGPHVVSAYYRFRPEAWGRGYAREAMAALLADHAVRAPGARAVILTDRDNAPSRSLARHLGFTPAQPPAEFGDAMGGLAPGRLMLARTLRGAGRYAPSPSGDLHLGNLRTALLAWVLARRSGRDFRLRVEDLDRVRPGAAERQLEDLAAIGLDWDGAVVLQSERTAAHRAAIAALDAAGLVYECYCTRREILEAPSAPHAPPGAYPGTCRDLGPAERAAGRARMAELHREPALRLRADVSAWTVRDLFAGEVTGPVDDLVLRRGDGVIAYNLAVVVDDAAAGIDQVTRGDDLLSSAPRQAHLAHLLGHPAPAYAHVPLALSRSGARLAKRDGAVTLRERIARGESAGHVVERIGTSLGLAGCRTAADVLERWDPADLPREPWVVDLPE